MANAQLLQAIIRKLTGGAKKSVDPDTAQFGPLNSPDAPRTLPGNRANTNHPDFDPGDFEGSPTQPLNPEDRVGGFNNAEPVQPELGDVYASGQIKNPGAVIPMKQVVNDFTDITGRPPTPEEMANPDSMIKVIDALEYKRSIANNEDIPF